MKLDVLDDVESDDMYCCDGSSPDDIVITGMAGRFPQSDNIEELVDGIYNKKNMISPTTDRWEDVFGIESKQCGFLKDLTTFDADFFRMANIHAYSLDPDQRLLFQVCYEAICDSGYHPDELKKKRVGVYCCGSNYDYKDLGVRLIRETPLASFLNCMRANRMSHFFDFIGPSYLMDGACGTSGVAFHNALNDFSSGQIDAAVICGSEIILNPEIIKVYETGGILAKGNKSSPFDRDSAGIIRSEAVACLLLQKARHARRCYATVLAARHTSSGYVMEGITVPSLESQIRLFQELLTASNLNATDIKYLELHGTGTSVGDPIEADTVNRVYCPPERKEPLLVGSLKSNIGHSEPVSGICSVIKVILAFETGLIAPNYGYENPNPNCPGLVEGAMKVVDEVTPFDSDCSIVNCFGFGGAISQIILKRNLRQIATKKEKIVAKLPQLVLHASPSEYGVKYALDYTSQRELGREFYSLLHKLAYSDIVSMPYRGYTIIGSDAKVEIKQCNLVKREVWYVMTGMGCQWCGMGCDLMTIETFSRSIHKTADVLKPHGIDLLDLIQPDSDHLLQNRRIIPAFVGICAIQIALIDVLRDLGIEPDGVIGHSVGELVCAYAVGNCTAEETILSAYWRGRSVETANLPEGAMAAVGMTWKEAEELCPPDVYPACHNAEDSVTLSGLKKPLENFISQLKKENRFARVVDTYGYAFHCKQLAAVAPTLKAALDTVIKNPKPKSPRWLSTSYTPENWDKPEANIADANYFVNNLMSNVRFAEAAAYVPKDAIIIEIGPHFLLQALLKRVIGNEATYFGMMKRHENNVDFLLNTIGKLYTLGLNPKVEMLYPKVHYPAPRGTATISNLIKWNPAKKLDVMYWEKPSQGCTSVHVETIAQDRYLLDHCIDGRALYPAAGYMCLAWTALANLMGTKMDEIPVVIENFKIHRASILSSASKKTYTISILNVGGDFEIAEGSSVISTGTITSPVDPICDFATPTYEVMDPLKTVNGTEVYSELRISGYEYGPQFQCLVEINVDGTQGLLKWTNKWIPYLDAHLMFFGMLENNRYLYLPTGALSVKIDPSEVRQFIEDKGQNGEIKMPVNFKHHTACCRSPGIEIRKLSVEMASRSSSSAVDPVMEKVSFIPYVEPCAISQKNKDIYIDYLTVCSEMAKRISFSPLHKENPNNLKIYNKIDEFLNSNNESYVLLNTLKKLDAVPTTDTFLKDIKNVFGRYLTFASDDLLYKILYTEQPLRHILATVVENTLGRLAITEVANGRFLTLPLINNLIKKQTTSKVSLKLLHSEPDILDSTMIDDTNIDVQMLKYPRASKKVSDQDLVVGSFLYGDSDSLQSYIKFLASMVKPKGFMLLQHREQISPPEAFMCSLCDELLQLQPEANVRKVFAEEKLTVVCKKSDSLGSTLYLLRLKCTKVYEDAIVNVGDGGYDSWVSDLRSAFAKANTCENARVWIVSEDSPYNGLIGMIKCLNKEPGGENIRCVFLNQNGSARQAKSFRTDDPFFGNVFENDLLMNVFQNGSWGSFQNMTIASELEEKMVEFSYLNIKKFGDLSSFQWFESDINHRMDPKSNEKLAHICYSALNFRDIMLSTGKINAGHLSGAGADDDCLMGFEFSGVTTNGRRVMSFVDFKGMSNAVLEDPFFWLDVPDHWSLEDAATVPVVYYTCYSALIVEARLKKGESILIHSGSGGVGIAAIRIALSLQCNIFVTVGTNKKRQYIKKIFPQIDNTHIGCSRDTSFEDLILESTSGKGVDVVLNSLADDKFFASTRCLAMFGRFIEIGKYDMGLDRRLGLKMFLKHISFHGVSVDITLSKQLNNREKVKELHDLIIDGISKGVVQPLDRTVFSREDTEKAFRFMASGKHIGKVLLKIRDEPKRGCTPPPLYIKSALRTYFYRTKSYIVVGGLGGFGVELVKWMLASGARNIVITSRYGARSGYHQLCLQRWKNKKYNVQVSTYNVAKKDEAKALLEEVEKIAPVGGIFNSAVVLKDAFMENQDWKDFRDVCAPKAEATKNLDELSRVICHSLDYFVCFSSISCGKGNAGQSNYGYANSVMERVCEKRRADGLHGLAIQWGIIGNVGVVHRHMGEDAIIAGVVSQKIQSCLDTLSQFLRRDDAVLSSYVSADVAKRTANQVDIMPQLAKIFGYKDPSEINMLRTFAELGLDSMIGIEIQQILESKYEITMSIKEIQHMKVCDMKDLVEAAIAQKAGTSAAIKTTTKVAFTLPDAWMTDNIPLLLNEEAPGRKTFIVHHSANDLANLKLLASKVKCTVYCLMCAKNTPRDNLVAMATSYFGEIQKLNENNSIHLVGYSSAASLALEIAGLCDGAKETKIQSLTVLDGSLELVNNLTAGDNIESGKVIEAANLCEFLAQFSTDNLSDIKEILERKPDLESRISEVIDLMASSSENGNFDKIQATEAVHHYMKTRSVLRQYRPTRKIAYDLNIIESSGTLLLNDVSLVKSALTKVCAGKITIHRIAGEKSILLENETINLLNIE